MSQVLHHDSTNFLDMVDEQYLAVIVTCKSKKLDPKIEPLYHQLCQKYPKANIYEGDRTELNRKPGNVKIITTSLGKPDIFLIYGQFYPGTADRPNDRKSKRLTWFQDALDEIAETNGFSSIGFPTQISRDGGGSWSKYYQAIKDFAQTIHLKDNKIKVTIYENPMIVADEKAKNEVPKKISLMNCLNVVETIDLESIKSNSKKIVFQAEKPTLNNRESVSQGVNRSRVRLKQKEENMKKKKMEALDLISSESSSQGAPAMDGDEISSDDYELEEDIHLEREKPTLTLEEDDTTRSRITKPKISLRINSHSPKKTKPKITLSPVVRYFPETQKNPDWSTMTLSTYSQTKLGKWSQQIFSLPEIKEIMGDIDRDLRDDLKEYGDKVRFLPAFDHIFRAFELSDWDQTRVVILGQDPYFSNVNEAMGLSFSVPDGVKIPPSLSNIFKEIKNTYDDYEIPKSGNLENWAKQGVLLLNSSLTVRHKKKECHMRIWKTLTDKIIQLISKNKEKPVVFMLWGNYSKSKMKYIDARKHIVLKSVHPSPMAANRGGWFGNMHFGTSNIKLMETDQDPIDWGA